MHPRIETWTGERSAHLGWVEMTHTNAIVRAYQNSDESAVTALWQDVLADAARHNEPALSIRNKLAVDRNLFYVAVLDEQVVGAVMGGYDGHRGWVYSLAVRPEFQRRGIATALMSHLEEELVKTGCLKINLQVRASNDAVVAFYETLGYRVEPRVSMGKRTYNA